MRKPLNADRLPTLVEEKFDTTIDHNPVRAKMSIRTRFAIAIAKKIRMYMTDGKEEKTKRAHGHLLRRPNERGNTSRLLEMNKEYLIDDG